MKGEHIYLRVAQVADADVIFSWENNPEHWLVSNTVAPYSREDILHFLKEENDIFENYQTRFMILDHKEQAVGCIDLFDFDPKNHRTGVGILIDPRFRGRGYGSEALGLIVRYCWEVLDLNGVHAEIISSNDASRKIFEENGFSESGVKKEWLWDGHAFVDQIIYQRLRRA